MPDTKKKRQAVIFPRESRILQQLGENIRLAMKRRKISQSMVHGRTGISKPTLRKIEQGDPTVSMGHYLRVLAVLGLAEDLGRVALDDVLGRKLQDIALLTSKPNPKQTNTSTDQAQEPPVTKRPTSDRVKALIQQARDRAKGGTDDE